MTEEWKTVSESEHYIEFMSPNSPITLQDLEDLRARGLHIRSKSFTAPFQIIICEKVKAE